MVFTFLPKTLDNLAFFALSKSLQNASIPKDREINLKSTVYHMYNHQNLPENSNLQSS